ncbi:MAG: hypothetical protein C4576_17715 [Desulfobacteraceae bacterium]|nr:MAG: hypothetical protein C4576_17715 [Desulfobacteraceae bacterium]
MRSIRVMIVFMILLIIPLLAPSSSAQADVDEYIQGEMKARKIPGLALAVIRGKDWVHAIMRF